MQFWKDGEEGWTEVIPGVKRWNLSWDRDDILTWQKKEVVGSL